jgi:hypothetical protein
LIRLAFSPMGSEKLGFAVWRTTLAPFKEIRESMVGISAFRLSWYATGE